MADGFRKLEIWQESLKLVVQIYGLVEKFPQEEKFGLIDQIKRSSNSIVANIAEGQGRYHFKDKTRFLYQARGELFETRSHLSVAHKLKYIDSEMFNKVDLSYENLARRISSYIKYLSSKLPNEPI